MPSPLQALGLYRVSKKLLSHKRHLNLATPHDNG